MKKMKTMSGKATKKPKVGKIPVPKPLEKPKRKKKSQLDSMPISDFMQKRNFGI